MYLENIYLDRRHNYLKCMNCKVIRHPQSMLIQVSAKKYITHYVTV